MDPGKAKTASTLVVDLIGQRVACRQCEGLWVPLTYSRYKMQREHSLSPSHMSSEWVQRHLSQHHWKVALCLPVWVYLYKRFPVAYVSFKAPAPNSPSMTPGLAKTGHAQWARRWEGATLPYVVISPPSLLLRSWRERFCVAGPHRGLGTPLSNADSSSQTEFPVYSLSSHF